MNDTTRNMFFAPVVQAMQNDPWTSYDEVTNAMTEGAGVTVSINGREYFMVVTPHQL